MEGLREVCPSVRAKKNRGAIRKPDPCISHRKLRMELNRFLQELDSFAIREARCLFQAQRIIAVSLKVVCHGVRQTRFPLIASPSHAEPILDPRRKQIHLGEKVLGSWTDYPIRRD